MIRVTSQAVRELERMMVENQAAIVRIQVTRSCGGFSYHIGLDDKLQDGDETLAVGGITLAFPKKYAQWMDIEIDCGTTAYGPGLVFRTSTQPSCS